jgi:hypothetical protein
LRFQRNGKKELFACDFKGIEEKNSSLRSRAAAGERLEGHPVIVRRNDEGSATPGLSTGSLIVPSFLRMT